MPSISDASPGLASAFQAKAKAISAMTTVQMREIRTRLSGRASGRSKRT